MKTSLRGAIEIASHEGIVPMPYRDSKGVLTFGVGHTAAAGGLDPATLPFGVEQPMDLVFDVFRADLAKFERRVAAAVKVPLEQHEFDALVSFDFNTGGIHRATLVDSLNRGDRDAAAREFLNWSKPPEIVPRRKREQALFRDGTYGDGRANVYVATAAGKVLWNTARRMNVAKMLIPAPPEAEPPPRSDEIPLPVSPVDEPAAPPPWSMWGPWGLWPHASAGILALIAVVAFFYLTGD